DYALETATRILNMVPTKKVDKTPYKLCRRVVELEDIQDEDTSPSENTSKIPMEVEGFEPPQEIKRILDDLRVTAAQAQWTGKVPIKVLLQCLLQKLNTSEAGMEAVWIRKFISGLVEGLLFDPRGYAWCYTYAYIEDGVNGYLLKRCIVSCKRHCILVAASKSLSTAYHIVFLDVRPVAKSFPQSVFSLSEACAALCPLGVTNSPLNQTPEKSEPPPTSVSPVIDEESTGFTFIRLEESSREPNAKKSVNSELGFPVCSSKSENQQKTKFSYFFDSVFSQHIKKAQETYFTVPEKFKLTTGGTHSSG
ncbi:hypothetical protein Tco_0991925, partial [Tanacetum coccineum]